MNVSDAGKWVFNNLIASMPIKVVVLSLATFTLSASVVYKFYLKKHLTAMDGKSKSEYDGMKEANKILKKDINTIKVDLSYIKGKMDSTLDQLKEVRGLLLTR